MKPLPHSVERSILIDTEPATVFSFFTDSALWSAWWGAGSSVEPHVGGPIKVVHSNGFVSTGEVLAIDPPRCFAFTFSMQGAQPILAEDSRVTLRLEPQGASTRLSVLHEVADAAVASSLPQGWRFHFSVFANALADHLYAHASDSVSQWFAAWSQADSAARTAALAAIAEPTIEFRDRYSMLQGLDELNAQLDAVQRFMPGISTQLEGSVRHCQGTVLADWSSIKEGKPVAHGTNVFQLAPSGKIRSVVGIRD